MRASHAVWTSNRAVRRALGFKAVEQIQLGPIQEKPIPTAASEVRRVPTAWQQSNYTENKAG